MARRVIIEFIDDYDEVSPADETIRFAADGVEYEIDLSASHAAVLREFFGGWTRHARRQRPWRAKTRSHNVSGVKSSR